MPTCPGTKSLERAALDSRAARLPSLIVAYSGGVDSAYLACAATRALGAAALCVTADSPSYPERHRDARACTSPREFAFNHQVIQTDEMARPEYRANPANRCYYCKHELYTHLTRDRARARHSGHRGRQQRRRSRRLPARASGGARVRRRQPARRGRADEGGDPRAVAARRAADLGRAGVRVPVVAHSVFQRSDRREAAHDRARRGGAAASSASGSAASAITTRPRAARARARRDGARARARASPTRSIASCARSATRTSRVDLRGYRLGSLNDALRLRHV